MFEFLVGYELYFCALAEYRRVLHSRFVMRRRKGRRLVDQHHRNHMLKANVWHIAVVHCVRGARGGTYDNLLYLIGLKWVALQEDFQRIERRLDGSPHGPSLDGGCHYFVSLAQLVNQCRRIGLW